MYELIVAVDQNYGIGYENKLPWSCKEELEIFKNKTMNNTIIVGSNTFITLPFLKDRDIFILSRRIFYPNTKNNYTIIHDISSAKHFTNKKIIIAGGAQVYNHALSNNKYVDTIHMSVMKKEYHCDTWFDKKLLDDFVIVDQQDYEEFTHYVLKRTNSGERQYLNLLNNIIKNGIERDGRNGKTLSIFTEHFKFDLREGFPLLSTKKMFIRGIIEEFLFFLRGETDSNILSQKKVRIWEGNTTKEFIENKGLKYAQGIMGPMYGYQWRKFGQDYLINEDGYPIDNGNSKGVDQLANVINLIKNDPHSRRILMTSYNPLQAEEGVLYPCHSITIQFYVDKEYLDMFCFNRSQDTFLGVPYNIASSSLLLIVVAQLTNKTPRFLNMTMGDTHLYEDHICCAKEQIERIPYKFPTIKIKNITDISDIETLKDSDFILENYLSYPTIKAKMVA
jgi:dihydrofolate reductase/thymidylate synthase